jgi:L-asparaginase
MKKKKVAVFHTGGTISMKKNEDGSVNFQENNPLVNCVLDSAELVEEQIFNISSPNMTEHTMVELANAIKKKLNSDNFDGVVVTHGTDTMEETAYFLDITVPATIPIVITGAMRSFNDLGSDGLFNYQSAIRVAISDGAKGMGTMIVFNEQIHAALSVTKAHATNLAGFQSPGFGPIGFITPKDVIFGRFLPSHTHYEVDSIAKNVLLIKIHAGINSTIFDALEALAEKQGKYPIDGLVVEALGTGNVPARIVECLQQVESRGIPIILATKCFDGIAQDLYDYSGGGRALKMKEVKSIIYSNGLSGPKARLKLAILLEKTTDIKEIEAEFAR